jgi:transcriptional regulator NrdR family protein
MSAGLQCPACGGDLTKVIDSRPTEMMGFPSIRRRRPCDNCGTRQTTLEVPVDLFETWRRGVAKELLLKLIDEVAP